MLRRSSIYYLSPEEVKQISESKNEALQLKWSKRQWYPMAYRTMYTKNVKGENIKVEPKNYNRKSLRLRRRSGGLNNYGAYIGTTNGKAMRFLFSRNRDQMTDMKDWSLRDEELRASKTTMDLLDYSKKRAELTKELNMINAMA